MKRLLGTMIFALTMLQFGFPASTFAQGGQVIPASAHGKVIIPSSSNHTPADAGVRSHTNIRILDPGTARPAPNEQPPDLGYGYETPASLACIYKLVPSWPGCDPNSGSATNPSGGSNTIVIVDAYDDPTAAEDLAYFSAVFNLPAANFTVVYAGGSAPPVDPSGGWELEESLDIEYAHAMSPNAKIYLVEANSNYDSDLFPAVDIATRLVICGHTTCPSWGTGIGEVSMSWGGEEYGGETSLDSFFVHHGVVYVASAGDAPGTIYPCTSPDVVCVGGTATSRNPFTGLFQYEVAWQETGGGPSFYEPRPAFQNSLSGTIGPSRGVPDVAFDADPDTGAWVFDSNDVDGSPGGWWIVGGTSLGAPSITGIINRAGHFYTSSLAELQEIYTHRTAS